jgi:hypothetical protein
MGPNVQMPSVAQMFDFERDDSGAIRGMTLKPEWAALFASLTQLSFNATRSGSTSVRPSSTNAIQRYPGMPFFDQQLGYPVFLKHASSNVWVDATGTPV